jgi:NADH-quinone oxidoreductase subunit G
LTCLIPVFSFIFWSIKAASKDQKAFEKAITALKSASYIKFNSFITNEEALILQKIKEKTGIRLVNKDAYEYKKFIEAYSSIGGKSLYSGNLDDIRNSDGIIVLGSMISAENPAVRYAVNSASKRKNAKVVYMHPIEDPLLATNVNKFVKYEPKSEEGVMAILASLFGGEGLDGESKRFFEDLDIGYVSSESSFDESEQEEIVKLFLRAKNKTLILGQDLYSHPRAENIAKLAALFEKASGFKVVIIPSQTNTLGVSMICDIDKEGEGFSVGYNEEGDFILTSFGSKQRDNALDMPALNQQEGTFVSIDKRVVPLNAAIEFKGYELNDLANAIGINKEFTIDYTKELPVSKGFKSISFDDLPNKFLNDGTEDRGYILDTKDTETSTSIEDVAELEEMNGGVVYAGSTVNGFSEATSICKQLAYEPDALYVGKGAMEKYALEENETVTIKLGSQSAKYKVAHDGKISSDIVIAASFEPNNPMFETLRDGYAFKRIEIIKG